MNSEVYAHKKQDIRHYVPILYHHIKFILCNLDLLKSLITFKINIMSLILSLSLSLYTYIQWLEKFFIKQ